MKNFRSSFIVLSLCLLIPFLICSCPLGAVKGDRDTLIVSVWNVQNIFNAIKDGNEYSEYLPSSGWTEQSYQKRLRNLSVVASYDKLSSSDVFIFNEVENNAVVEDIMSLSFFRKNGFTYYATAGELNGAIKTALISKIPIVNAKVHSITNVRPVLEVELQNSYEHVFILALHAKSNKEGVSETAPQRLAQANAVKEIFDNITDSYPDALVIIAGDFNESFSDKNMMCDARNSSLNCPLKLLPDFKTGYLYCPWLDSNIYMKTPGSYFYNGEWECLDNILVSQAGKDGKGWEYVNSGVVFQGILQTTDNKPNAYRRDLLSGVSDHLPLWIEFCR